MLPLIERPYTKRYDNSARLHYSLTVDHNDCITEEDAAKLGRGTSTTEITPRKVNLNKRRQSGELRRKVVIAANARRMQTRPKASKRFRLTHPKNLHTARSLALSLSLSGSNSEPFVRRGMSINFLSEDE